MTSPTSNPPATDTRGVEILARSLYRDLRAQGFSSEQIITLSSKLLSHVRDDLARQLAAE